MRDNDSPDLDAAFGALQQQVVSVVPMPATETMVARGKRRVAVRTAVLAVTAIAVIAAGGAVAAQVAGPERGPRVATTPSPSPTPSLSPEEDEEEPLPEEPPDPVYTPPPAGGLIPRGFLLYEAEAAANPTTLEHWTNSPTIWPPAFCIAESMNEPRSTAKAERSLVFAEHRRAVRSETLVVWATPDAARAAFRQLRAAQRRCSAVTEAESIGDDTLMVKDPLPNEDYRWTLFVRRGAAIVEYDGLDRPRVLRDAETMVGKLCRFGGC